MNAMTSKKLEKRRVNKLSAVVGLKGNYRELELGASISNEVNEEITRVGLTPKRERPHVMGEIINNNKVELVTRIASNR
jgi:hypothetical protein